MAVIIKYAVERNGEEKMTFTTKAEADAYDKMLDQADSMLELIEKSGITIDDTVAENLSHFLAENREDVLVALGAKRKAVKKATPTDEQDEE
ncbi:YebG family protein [Vibrio coralliirubri]|uniref:YebG family protein n=1 Tax=Vibrio coralliirubri TaxID=1516159 RepID=UPI002284E870|nr:YebG family protein [Vibrio coralliirubri]MCY9861436.1 YebG family protein [Vibrio coralliirubri]